MPRTKIPSQAVICRRKEVSDGLPLESVSTPFRLRAREPMRCRQFLIMAENEVTLPEQFTRYLKGIGIPNSKFCLGWVK